MEKKKGSKLVLSVLSLPPPPSFTPTLQLLLLLLLIVPSALHPLLFQQQVCAIVFVCFESSTKCFSSSASASYSSSYTMKRSTSSSSMATCTECRTRPARAFLPCGHNPLCLNCADNLLTTMTPTCPTCQLRFIDYITVPLSASSAASSETAKLLQMVVSTKESPSSSSTSTASTPSSSSPVPHADLPPHEQVLQAPTYAQARDLYAKGMALLGDGASACSTPVLEKPAAIAGATGVPEVPTKAADAFKVFVQSAGLGFPFSQFMVAIMLQSGVGCTANEELALKWLKKASSGDLALAQVQLAQMYSSGKGVYKDLAKMVKLYRKAAVAERAFALVSFGYCLLFGHGVDQDFGAARELLLAACNAGDKAKANYYLALIYFNGLAVPVSPKNGFEYFLLAATNGSHPAAQHWVSRCFASGTGTNESQAEAAKWAMKAAERGHAAAQHDLGCRYMSGNGVPVDQKLGASWTEKAADQNNVGAIISLAFYFSQGQGTDQSEEDAEACRQLAKGLLDEPIHKLDMGECLEWGEGADRSVDSAKEWYRDASITSTHAEFALSRHGEESKRALRKAQKQASAAAAATAAAAAGHPVPITVTMSTGFRPRSKSAAMTRPDAATLSSASSPAVLATGSSPAPPSSSGKPTASSSSSLGSSPQKPKKLFRMRRSSAGHSSAPNLSEIREDISGEGSDPTLPARKFSFRKPRTLSFQFKRSPSTEALKNVAVVKKTRFASDVTGN